MVVAFSVHGAHVWVSAVTTAIIGGIWFINLSFVVVGYNGFDITHAAIAQFKRVLVENLVKWVWFREVLIIKRKEALSYICFDILAERWIVPKNVSWAVPPWLQCLIVWLFVRQVTIRQVIGTAQETFFVCFLVFISLSLLLCFYRLLFFFVCFVLR